ncbi:NAD(P)-binding domain-containing protein [Nodosilinea sp. LEGE 07088]|uniref:NAD(P)/FAD-dependent oxidoreductase n=1 Tax=Nodosilinea sp. LEGE 07088 TaxID=2777968 RepID=UPI001881052F|nr:NAD(P)/FAD-dependent oxidoreductase [Nodosilinea sp. LEGE 07088]MBE9141349.1 NAD(P)-binding domain-containing protein [Nodosilinea sp. LEGE 07088]
MSLSQTNQSYDVVIVGAGAAGIGCGVVLKDLGLERFTLLERHQVGASFSRWPDEMSFITPSFPSHGFGLLDLNSVTLKTSPAIAFRREHISGKQYALYLQTVADHFELPIQTEVDVQTVEPLPQGGFTLHTSSGEMSTQFVIWAAGEYQYPHLNPFPGAEHCLHNSQIRSWTDLEGDEFIIIGGYESGMDAAANLVALGKKVSVLDRTGAWADPDTDPSVSLSPYTLQRLEFVRRTGRLDLVGDAPIEAVKPIPGGYAVYSEYQKWVTAHPPILCTGFDTSLKQIAHLFDWSEGYAALTENDESTLTPGLFVSGPSVRHGDLIFCFIYKFRQRFAVIANAIAYRLGLDPTPLEAYRQAGLFLDDLSCCSNDCIC